MHESAVLLLDGMALTTVRPIEAAVRMEARAVTVGAVGGPLEAADDQFTFVGDTTAGGVGEFPDARRVRDVEAAIEKISPLGVGKFVREDRAVLV